MSAPLTLPGDIIGLLRRGSPVTDPANPNACGVIFGIPGYDASRPRLWGINWLFVIHQTDRAPALDLSDPTGRVHATWWLDERVDTDEWPGGYHHLDDILGPGHWGAVVSASQGEDMDDKEIARLRRVVLHVAGRPL